MRAVVQRVRDASVIVSGRSVGSVAAGLLVYLGVGRNDTDKDLRLMCDKIVNLRIFPDENGKMNRSVTDVRGEIMVVSQFTLFGDAREGRRPSYIEAAPPELARSIYEKVVDMLRDAGFRVATGEFQAAMEVTYTNLGPVTILLDSEKRF
ncbi:MAG TPA: D-aminoacyl-tRNA deacylase [Spirochaetia bacterium]|nr:D-aminoacyl-tRNA deacylase [Spirochaetia bacterium]